MMPMSPLLPDDVINLAAREMTETGEVDLAAAVRARLRRRPESFSSRRVAVAGGLIAAAVAIVALWPRPQAPETPAIARVELGKAAGAIEIPNAVTPERPILERAPRTRASAAEEAAWLARAIPALAPVAHLKIDPIQPSRTSIAPITVEPFGLQTIELPPIDIRSSGGR